MTARPQPDAPALPQTIPLREIAKRLGKSPDTVLGMSRERRAPKLYRYGRSWHGIEQEWARWLLDQPTADSQPLREDYVKTTGLPEFLETPAERRARRGS